MASTIRKKSRRLQGRRAVSNFAVGRIKNVFPACARTREARRAAARARRCPIRACRPDRRRKDCLAGSSGHSSLLARAASTQRDAGPDPVAEWKTKSQRKRRRSRPREQSRHAGIRATHRVRSHRSVHGEACMACGSTHLRSQREQRRAAHDVEGRRVRENDAATPSTFLIDAVVHCCNLHSRRIFACAYLANARDARPEIGDEILHYNEMGLESIRQVATDLSRGRGNLRRRSAEAVRLRRKRILITVAST